MYIKQISIKNYRNFCNTPFVLQLKPFTLVLGPNNVGKTNLLNAIALLFGQDLAIAQRRVLDLDDINYTTVASFKKNIADRSVDAELIDFPEVVIDAILQDFDSDQESVVGDWFTDPTLEAAQVTYRFCLRANFDRAKWIESQRDLLRSSQGGEGASSSTLIKDEWKRVEFPIRDYRYSIYGGGAAGNECDAHFLGMLRAEVLDALRDARQELMGGGDQRMLYRVLRQGADTKYADLKQRLSDLEKCVQENASLKELKKSVQDLLERVSLQNSAGDNVLDFQFSSPDATELLKKIGMIYGTDPINVSRNGLGRNNLLYLSLVLSQLSRDPNPTDESYVSFRFVGIEEPEAHLHPQLQDHLARNIEAIRQEHAGSMQLVLTSHSTHIAAKLKLQNTVVLFQDDRQESIGAHYILEGLDEKKHQDSIRFLSLYLDATKSRMFFARRLILVEGISEQVLMPRLFEIHHKGAKTLEGFGTTILNVNGVAFRHFLTIVRSGFFRRCAVITDSDSTTQRQDRATALKSEFDTKDLIQVCITKSSTFEKDIINANKSGRGRAILLQVLQDMRPQSGKKLAVVIGAGDIPTDDYFKEIEDQKAEFAFNVARLIDDPQCGFKVPDYISSAFTFLE